MMQSSLLTLVSVGTILFAVSGISIAQGTVIESDALGIWLSENGNEKIEIFRKGDSYFGRMVWMKEPADENGKIKVDSHNPDPNLRSRAIVGIEMLHDFKYSGDGVFIGGKIYDPGNGKTYQARIQLTDRKTAKIRGFIGIPLFGRTELCTKTK